MHLLELPAEIRLQIWLYALSQDKELLLCQCLRTSRKDHAKCSCYSNQDQPTVSNINSSTVLRNLVPPLPLVCRQIRSETLPLMTSSMIPATSKTIVICHPDCLGKLLKACSPVHVPAINHVRLDFDLRQFRQPGVLPYFREIWNGLYYAHRDARAVTSAYFSSTEIVRPDPAIIEPNSDFYPLHIFLEGPFLNKSSLVAKGECRFRKGRETFHTLAASDFP